MGSSRHWSAELVSCNGCVIKGWIDGLNWGIKRTNQKPAGGAPGAPNGGGVGNSSLIRNLL